MVTVTLETWLHEHRPLFSLLSCFSPADLLYDGHCPHTKPLLLKITQPGRIRVRFQGALFQNQSALPQEPVFISEGCGPSCAMVQLLGTKDGRASGTTTCQARRLSTTRWAWNSLQQIRCFSTENFIWTVKPPGFCKPLVFQLIKISWSHKHDENTAADCVTNRWLRNFYVRTTNMKNNSESQFEQIKILKKSV